MAASVDLLALALGLGLALALAAPDSLRTI